jgi:hypothetical protein
MKNIEFRKLTDNEWDHLFPILKVKPTNANVREAANVCLYRFFYRCPGLYRSFNWHALPLELGINPKTANRYYLDWTRSGLWLDFWDAFHHLRSPAIDLPKASKKSLMKMTPIRAVIAELERAYVHFNVQLAGGLLPSYTPISIDGEHSFRMRGYIQSNVWFCEKTELYHIALMPQALTNWQVALSVLLHEMAHLRNLVAGIDDTDTRTQYHTIDFRESARLLGLSCEKTKLGFSKTSMTSRAIKVVNQLKPLSEVLERIKKI